jgi:hypothetical protein
MNDSTPARAKSLTRNEVMDLVRAGIVLAITIGLTMIVPDRIWGAGAPERAAVSIGISK